LITGDTKRAETSVNKTKKTKASEDGSLVVKVGGLTAAAAAVALNLY